MAACWYGGTRQVVTKCKYVLTCTGPNVWIVNRDFETVHTDLEFTIFFVDKMGYITFYLSSNGTDTSACGETEYTACATLDHVLSLYYGMSSDPHLGLEIITSKSFIINQNIMVSLVQHF